MKLWIEFKKNFFKFINDDSYNTKGSHVFRHWWHQRLSAIFVVLLTVLLTEFLTGLLSTVSIPVIVKLFRNPYTGFLLSFWVLVIFYHGAIGIQVIIEDYIKSNKLKRIFILLVRVYSAITIIVFLVVAVINIGKV